MTDDEGLTEDEFHAELKRKAAIHVPAALLPCAAIALAGPATSPTGSFVGGHPYLPAGAEWPRVPLVQGFSGFGHPAAPSWRSNRAYRFVMQVNFAEVPPLPGYPTSGLLQWFVENDQLHGHENNGVDGTGFTVRWYDDLTAPAQQPPSGPVPDELHDGELPIHLPDGPRALSFTPALSVPEDTQDLPGQFKDDEIWEEFEIHVEDSWLGWVTEHCVGDPAFAGWHTKGSKIGGYPWFTQDDPRPGFGTGSAEQVLIHLDSTDDFGDWNGSGLGTVQLFGDPAALAAGKTAGMSYYWDCT